jgi:hypothetical protein
MGRLREAASTTALHSALFVSYLGRLMIEVQIAQSVVDPATPSE